jgi:hypothetical protein
MQPTSVKITGKIGEYTFSRVGDKYYINGKEVIQKSFNDLTEDDKIYYEENKEDYDDREILFLTNLQNCEPFSGIYYSGMNPIMFQIMLLIFNSENRIYGKHIIYKDNLESKNYSQYKDKLMITLTCMNKKITFSEEENLKEKILELIS